MGVAKAKVVVAGATATTRFAGAAEAGSGGLIRVVAAVVWRRALQG